MRSIVRNAIFAVAVLLIAGLSVIPPETKLRLGKDLRGGVTLVYSVQIEPGENPREVLSRTIEVLMDRVDPSGLLEIQMVAQGQDRIEVTMPLPGPRVLELRQAFEDELATLGRRWIEEDRFDPLMRRPADERRGEIERIAGDDEGFRDLLLEASERFDEAARARDAFNEAREASEDDGLLDGLLDRAASAADAYDEARERVFASMLSPRDVRRALELSTYEKPLRHPDGQFRPSPSPRARALDRLREQYPEQRDQIERIIGAYDTYIANRTSLDDPQDLIRMLSGAGVLSFRITIDPQGSDTENTHPEEERLRADLRERGPRNVRARDARWYKINRIENWYDSVADLEFLEEDPAGYFASRRGLVVEEYEGEHWVLAWDTAGLRLTPDEGNWQVASSYQTTDEFGRPAIGFRMDTRGARALGRLTGPNLGRNMAVLLDNEVYTSPVLRGAISRAGQISGDFTREERNYIIRVLAAGSLQARLSPEPISINTIAPELGMDNLLSGMKAGVAALIAVSAFMVFYYFSFGGVAILTLLCNAILILGAMSLSRAAFTLPGIAGVILTFGMAVDANVLIYERIREELRRGVDLRIAVRLGYQRALSAIVDGNVTNLIVCFVLAYTGTQEVRGFAITLGIGVVATLFSCLFISRIAFALMLDVVHVKKLRMLPMAIPVIERWLEPKIDWVGLRWLFVAVSATGMAIGVGMIAYQGEEMLDTEFRGGTQVTLQLRHDDEGDGTERLTMTRREVEERVHAIGAPLDEGDPLRPLRAAQVIPINPRADGVTSDRFAVKTFATEQALVVESIIREFADVIVNRPPLRFDGREITGVNAAPVFPVLTARLGDVINDPRFRDDVSEYLGGVAIVLQNMDPPPSIEGLTERLDQRRGSDDFSDTLARQRTIRVLEETPEGISAAVILVRDDAAGFFESEEVWTTDLARREWRLTREALIETTTLASVQSFSPIIAETFRAQATVAVMLALLLILIYIWVRFGSVRYSGAAIAVLIHDVMIMIGLIALAEIVYDSPVTGAFAQAIGLQPFRIDLNLVAAVLTIIGYSLNDTIVIMDRIRENRGKLSYASRAVVNESINQTISRTVITSGTTLIATLILFIFGGPGVRAFAYALTIGIIVGTYSSIAVAAPLVWSRKTGGPIDEPTDSGTGGGEPKTFGAV